MTRCAQAGAASSKCTILKKHEFKIYMQTLTTQRHTETHANTHTGTHTNTHTCTHTHTNTYTYKHAMGSSGFSIASNE